MILIILLANIFGVTFDSSPSSCICQETLLAPLSHLIIQSSNRSLLPSLPVYRLFSTQQPDYSWWKADSDHFISLAYTPLMDLLVNALGNLPLAQPHSLSAVSYYSPPCSLCPSRTGLLLAPNMPSTCPPYGICTDTSCYTGHSFLQAVVWAAFQIFMPIATSVRPKPLTYYHNTPPA